MKHLDNFLENVSRYRAGLLIGEDLVQSIDKASQEALNIIDTGTRVEITRLESKVLGILMVLDHVIATDPNQLTDDCYDAMSKLYREVHNKVLANEIKGATAVIVGVDEA